MRKIKSLSIIVSLLILLLSIAVDTYAAYVGNPSRIFNPKAKQKRSALFTPLDSKHLTLFTEGIADIIYDRGAKHQADDMKVDFYGASAGLIYKNIFVLYGGLGAAKVEEAYIIRNQRVRWETDYGFTWLAGAMYKVYETEFENFYNSRLSLSVDGQFRNTGIDPDVISIGSVEFSIPHSNISYSSIEYNDWHLALSCALEMGMFSPYAGIKYSDFESCVRVVENGILYQKGNAEADDNFGVFIGASINVADSFYAGVEASFIDENSLSGSLSWKF